MRTFLGIALTPGVAGTLAACKSAALDEAPSWRSQKWVPAENLHVTVRFLGDLSESDVSQAAERLADELAAVSTYDLELDRAVALPRPGAATLLWVEAERGARETAALAGSISSSLQGIGHQDTARRFRTHVTLCRSRVAALVPPRALAAMDTVIRSAQAADRTMSVGAVTLYESQLTGAGPLYRIVRTFALGRD